jgi:hypothetical protein
MSDLRLEFPDPCGEGWGTMRKSGCHRHCGVCDTNVLDLAQYDVCEIEALLRSGQSVCAKAEMRSDGTIKTKRQDNGNLRRAIVAAGVSASLVASLPAAASEKDKGGSIVGRTFTFGTKTIVEARSPTGKVYKTRVKLNEKYQFKNLPKGTYKLTFYPSCGGPWTIENVTVFEGETFVPESPDAEGCIIVGKLQMVDNVASS